jgi:uncharacterized protein (DUF1330 family)
MTVKITVTSIKSSDVNFPEYDQALEAHLNTNYISTGKLLFKETVRSKIDENDTVQNRRTFVMEFDSAASFNEFQNDPARAEARAARNAYFEQHGIVNTTVIEYFAPDVEPV